MADAAPHDDAAPQPIAGRYVLVAPLGAGGMGRVDLAEDTHTGARVALKRVALAEPRAAESLRRELSLRRGLAHPQVPAAHALGHDADDGSAWLALEYVDGLDLLGGVEAWGPDALPELLALALNVVAFLHRRGVVHGDLKPANIVVSHPTNGARPTLALLDFGLARLADTEGDDTPHGGTLAYMAPSQQAGGRASPSTDLFALGRSFVEALALLPVEAADGEALAPARRVIERLVHLDEDLRYAHARDALTDLLAGDAEARRALPAPHEAPLVGREDAWRVVRGAIGGLHAGLLEHGVLVIESGPGMGRTRMLRAARDEAALAGTRVVSASVPLHAGPLEAPLAIARRLLPGDAPELRAVHRALARDEVPVRALRDLWQALQRAAAAHPVLLLVDDAHRADPATLSFLTLAARLPARSGPLLIASWWREPGAVDARLDALTQVGAADRLRLDPLDARAARALARSLLPEDAPAVRAEEIAALSEGNPHVATLLAREGATPAATDAGSLLASLLTARIATLTRPAHAALDALAVLERPAPASVVAPVADLAPDVATRALDELAAAGLADGRGLGRARRHAIAQGRLRALVLARTASEALRAMHARAHAAWSAWPRAADRPPAMLVHHALAAGEGASALDRGMDVARQLALQGSVEDATALLERLLAAADIHDAERAVTLRVLLAHVHTRAGRHAAAEALLDGPLASAARADPALAARLALLRGSVHESRGNLEAAEQALAAAAAMPVEALGPTDRMQLWEKLGAVHFRQGRHEDAREAWRSGLAEVPEGDASLEHANLLNDLGAIDTWQGHLDRAAARHEAALTLRRGRGDLDGESRSLTNLANLALKRADFVEARAHYAESLRLKREVGTLQAQAVTLANLAIVCNLLGDYADALAQLEESMQLRMRSGDVIGEAITRRQRAALFLHKGELGRAAEELDRARALLASANAGEAYALPFAFQEAELELQRGHPAAAARRAGEALAGLAPEARATERFDLLLLRSRAWALLGETERAREDVRAATASFADQGDALNLGWCRLLEGRLRTALGDVDEARAALGDAEATAARLGARRLACEAALARARLEAEADPDRAARALATAARLADDLGVPDLVLAVHELKGWQSLRLGQARRALGWWRRGAERLNEALARLGADDDVERFLQHPERRRVLEALDGLVAAEEQRSADPAEIVR